MMMSQHPHNTPLSVLKSVFGYDEFRHKQGDVITHVMGGGSGLVVMPTGGGKSLCFQIPALCRQGTAIVISPLIALMQDQVAMLKQFGVRAETLNSQSNNADAYNAFVGGELDILYVSPERLLSDGMMQTIATMPISLIAVDEAHCISQWGHDFRPEYTKLKTITQTLQGVPILALTATADKATQADIKSQLGMENSPTFLSGFDRPNIKYMIKPKTNGKNQILRFIEDNHRGDCGIVYCTSRKSVDSMAAFLRENGINAHPYHAGMAQNARGDTLHTFQYHDDVVVVATIAFGMGIDKPNVRFVAHFDAPKNIESYYQETGRAGRDGLPATAFMTYGAGSIGTQRMHINESLASETQKILEHKKLDYLASLCETPLCRRRVLLEYFNDTCTACDNCDNCENPPETYDATIDVQKLLSCIYRTGQRFGRIHIIDVLRGSENARVKQFNHNTLSTYGIGADLSAKHWKHILSQILTIGLIDQPAENKGGITISPKGMAFLKEKQTIQLSKLAEDIVKKKTTTPKKNKLDLSPDHIEIFEKLRAKRMELAQQQEVPAFVILSDATLINMIEVNPQTLDEMLTVSGIGQSKLEQYGQIFLDVLLER